MAGPNNILTKTFVAGAAIAKNTLVKFTTGDKVINATGATDLIVGVALEAAAADLDRIEIGVLGIFDVKAAGVISAGAFCVATTGGEAVALSAAATIKTAGGQAMATVADNDIFPMLRTPFQAVTA